MRSTTTGNFRFFADNSRGYIEQANELHAKRKYEEARELLRSALVELPDDPFLEHALAKRLRSTYKDDEEALQRFAKAYEKRPDVFIIALDYANFLAKKGGAKLAEVIMISLYNEEEPNNNRNLFVLGSLGHIYDKQGLYQRAAACFDGCLQIDENDEVALRRLREIESFHPGFEVKDEHWDEFMNHSQETINAAVKSGLWKEPPPRPVEPEQP